MRNWDTRDESGTDSGCEWKKDWEDVQRVCRMLGLKCEMVSFQGFLCFARRHVRFQVDLSREYWTRVFEPALEQWEAGSTPNPDIWCNKYARFLQHPLSTTHHARIER